MSTIRRIYAYLLSFAGLALLSVAAANLGQVVVDVVLGAPSTRASGYVVDTVSQNAAAALVGLPIWLLHWLWIERSVRGDELERASALRRLYLYVVLGAASLVLAASVRDALINVFSLLLGPRTSDTSLDSLLRPLPFSLVALIVWLAHWRIATRDRQLVGEAGASATLRRWYRYGAAFIGFGLMLAGAQGVLAGVWRIVADSAFSASSSSSPALAVPAASALVGLGLWLVHWVRLGDPALREDGVSVLRSVYLFLVLAVAVLGALLGISQLLYYAVGRLLGVSDPGGVGGNLLQAAAEPASFGLVYGIAWAYQRTALRRQAAAFDEAPRQAGIRRLYTYLVAFLALGVLASGVAGLLWTVADVLLNAPAATSGDGWRGQVALFATLAVVGLLAWLSSWRPAPASPGESRSLARRVYVYLALIAAMLTLLASMGALLYRLINLMLGAGASVSLRIDLAHAAAVASVAACVAVYHWRILRRDSRAAPAPAEEPAAVEPGSAAPSRALVEILAADAESLNRALSVLRSTGVQVTLR